jgi:ribonuclease Z
MIFEVTILGSSSATPTAFRHPTSQVLNINEKLFMIDCGEGTQIQLIRYKIKYQRINHIFISHMHGDHYFGLVGFLSTMHLQGRNTPLNIYGPPELEQILQLQLNNNGNHLNYQIIFHALEQTESKVIFEDKELQIETIVLSHRIPCTGFLFREKERPRKLIRDKVIEYDLPISAFHDLKDGKDYIDENGKVYKNEDFTTPSRAPRSYAYCSDTIYNEAILPQINNVDLLYHESTFMNDSILRAQETFHTTSLQAGIIAAKAKAQKLIIGHFSARYRDLQPVLLEARSQFENTSLAIEGEKFRIE